MAQKISPVNKKNYTFDNQNIILSLCFSEPSGRVFPYNFMCKFLFH